MNRLAPLPQPLHQRECEWETIQADQAAEVLRGWPGGNDPLEGLA